MNRIALLLAMLLSIITVSVSAAPNEIVIPNGNARVLELPSKVATIIIGNPEIVQATLIDDKTMVVSGLALGETNLITLAKDGSIASSIQIFVNENEMNTLTIFRRETAQHLSCTPYCRPI